MTELALETRGLRKQYGEKVAVEDLTLQVERGEVFGFLGPNGAGKTTSIKMLLSLVAPTAGVGALLGRPLGETAVRRRVGYLPEHFRFHDWLTAAEFLDFHGKLFGMPRARRQAIIPDLLELVGLQARAQTRLREFSKGMTQRIGLAQALMNDPELVFLDEPTSGLDPIGRRLVREIVDGLREQGTAVFINSHLLSEIEQTCDRVGFIRDGRILEVSPMADLERSVLQVGLRVGQPTPELLEALGRFGDRVELHRPSGRVSLTISGEEVLPRLAAWLVESGHTLYELSPHHLTLEERFLQVIGSQTGDH